MIFLRFWPRCQLVSNAVLPRKGTWHKPLTPPSGAPELFSFFFKKTKKNKDRVVLILECSSESCSQHGLCSAACGGRISRGHREGSLPKPRSPLLEVRTFPTFRYAFKVWGQVFGRLCRGCVYVLSETWTQCTRTLIAWVAVWSAGKRFNTATITVKNTSRFGRLITTVSFSYSVRYMYMSFTRVVGLLSETMDQIQKQRYATSYYELASPKIFHYHKHTAIHALTLWTINTLAH